MKKYILVLILLFFAGSGIKAQTFSDDNFVYTAAPKKAVQSGNYNSLTKDDIKQNVTFFDGLGRPVQTTAINQGGNGSDIITPVEYDGLGRQPKEYLPYFLSNSTTTYPRIALASSISASNGIYNTPKYENTANPFSLKKFETSPLNRVLKQAAPGNSWVMDGGHEIKLDYQTNTATEVKLYKATATWNAGSGLYDITFSDAGNYGVNQLYKTVTYDENSAANPTDETAGSTVEFKNKEGQVILKRTYDGGAKHDTYYVYDTYGNLTYVLPPKAEGTIDATILNNLCYQYKYDNRNRLVEQKLPGKQWEFIVYDKLDRPVATGPASSPFKDDTSVGWIIAKYDTFSRPIYTGWSNQTATSAARKTLQDAQNLATVLYETKQTSGTIDGIAAYYTNLIAPTSFKLLTVNYYDNYVFPGAQAVPSTIEGQVVLTNVKGLATGNWKRVVTTATAISGDTNTTFYDGNARPIQTYNQNYLTGYTSTSSNLDFAGKTIYTVTKHKRTSGSTELVIREDFTYSVQDRLLTHTHQINGGAIQLIAANTYDNLGQLMSKNVGNSTGSPLQKVDFNYNIRGWLTEINKTADLQQGSDPKDLFAFKISYNNPQAAIAGVTALYNGNISETLWKTGSDALDRGYGFQYDKLNRLKNTIYEKNGLTTNAYDENITYDKNGNIMTLVRKGDIDPQAGTIVIDNLAYTYPTNSNQLGKVDDTANNTSGFNDFNKVGDDYTYDVNGNMITDKNKNITAITYNHFNLPKKITFATTGTIEYIYNAAGQKIQKIVSETGKTVIVTDYLGGFQYKDNILEFFPTAEGYVKNTAGALSYVFQYKDHLGNIRVAYAKNATTQVLEIIEENNYYPFGLKHKGYNDYIANTNKYKYNNKELQDELGLGFYDYGARNYDPALGRWMNIDPLSEKMRRWSPYNYCFDNPMKFVDPDGMGPEDRTVSTSSDYSLTYNGKNKYTLTQVNTVSIENKNEDGSTTTNTISTTTNINYKMSTDKSGKVNMKITGGSTQVRAIEKISGTTAYGGPMVGGTGSGSSSNEIVNYSRSMNAASASSEVNKDKDLSRITGEIQDYHDRKGADHNIFMDPKNSDIDPFAVASGGIIQEALRILAPATDKGIKGGGVLTTIMGWIPTAVDKYYAGDSERSIGRTATIKL